MNLAQPWGLVALALAAPIVVAYLHRRHVERRPVASVLLVRLLRDEQPASQRARARLRHRVSLAMILAALAAAMIALVGPSPSSGKPRRLIVVLDRSASMGAHDGAAGARLDRAAAAVAELADGLGPDDELALVTTGADAGVQVAPTVAHADVVRRARALAAAGAAGTGADDALAFRLADGLCADPTRAELVIVSDGAGLSAPPGRCPRRHVAVGHDAGNVGVTALSARLVDGLGLYDVHVGVASTWPAARQVDVTLAVDGEVVDVVALDVPARGDAEKTVRVTLDRAGGRALSATIAGNDALAADDRATVAMPDAGPVQVLLVSAHPHSLVAEVLRLHPRARLTVAAPGAPAPGRFDLIVLEDDPRAALPPAPVVVGLGVAPDGAPLALGDQAIDRAVIRWDFDGPWFRYVDLHDVVVAKARLVAGGTALVDSGSGALAATAPWGARTLVVTGFALDDTDLALRAAFPNLIADLVDGAAPPPAAAAPTAGVLSAAESHLAPQPLPGDASPPGHGWRGAAALARLALGLAIALLFAEQLWLLALRRRERTPV